MRHHPFPVALAPIRSRRDHWCSSWFTSGKDTQVKQPSDGIWDVPAAEPGIQAWGRVIALDLIEQGVSEISIRPSSVRGWTGLPCAGIWHLCSSVCSLPWALQRVEFGVLIWVMLNFTIKYWGKLWSYHSVCVYVFCTDSRAHWVILNFCCFVRHRRSSCL